MSRSNEQISNISKELELTKVLLEEASKQLDLEKGLRREAEDRLDRVQERGVTLTAGSVLPAPGSVGEGIGRSRLSYQYPLATTKPPAASNKNRNPAPGLLPRPDLPTINTNPTLKDSVETWYDYYSIHQKSWPRGVRCDALRRPILSDLRADRAIARF